MCAPVENAILTLTVTSYSSVIFSSVILCGYLHFWFELILHQKPSTLSNIIADFKKINDFLVPFVPDLVRTNEQYVALKYRDQEINMKI